MTTERDVPTFYLRAQLAPRGDIRWDLLEECEPFHVPDPSTYGGWCNPDDFWGAVRAETAIAFQTWIHRIRRGAADGDSGLPLPRD